MFFNFITLAAINFYTFFLSHSFNPQIAIQELVVDLLQSIVEIVTYGDRQDPMIFEYEFCSILCWYGFNADI